MKNIGEIAQDFADAVEKNAARGRQKTKKRKRTRRQITKDLEGQKKKYQTERKRLSDMEKKRDRLEKDISECRDSMRSSRGNLLNFTDVLKNMDLSDCRHAIFYDNDTQDVGYILDGNEVHLSTNDEGDLDQLSMKDHQIQRKRQMRDEKRQQQQDSAQADIPPSIGPDEVDAEVDDSIADDSDYVWDSHDTEDTTNFRFFD